MAPNNKTPFLHIGDLIDPAMPNKELIKVLQLTIDELKLEEDSKDDDDDTEEMVEGTTQPKNGTEVDDSDLEDVSDEDLKGKKEYPPEVFLAGRPYFLIPLNLSSEKYVCNFQDKDFFF